MKLRLPLLLCVLLFSPPASAVAPPRGNEPLPRGAIRRLGYAQMTANYGFAVISPDGRWVYSGKWYDLTDGKAKKAPIYIPKDCYLERFFADGSYLVYGNGYHIFSPTSTTPLIRSEIADQVRVFDHTGKFGVQALSDPEGSEIALIDLRQGEIKKGRRLLVQTKCESYGPSLSDHGKHVVWIDTKPSSLCFYDVPASKLRRVMLPDNFKYPWTAMSRDGQFASCRSQQSVVLYEVKTGKQIRLTTGLTGDDRSGGQFTPDGKAWTVQTDRGLAFVPTDPRQPVEVRPVWISALFPDGRRGIAITGGNVLRVIDLKTGKQLDNYSRFDSFRGVQLLDEHSAVAWGPWGQVVVWDIRDGRVLSQARMTIPKNGAAFFMRVHRDGKVLTALSIGDQAGVLAEVRTGKVLAEIPGYTGISADFAADGSPAVVTQLTKAENKTALWLPGREDSQPRLLPVPSGSVLMAPDGRSFVLAGDQAISLIEVVSGKQRWKKDVPALRSERIYNTLTLATRDTRGRIIAVRQRDVAILDAVTGRTIKAFFCNADTQSIFQTAAISATGRWLALYESEEGELRVFDLDAEDADRPVLTEKLPTGISGLAITEDGSKLVSSHANGTCLVWDLRAMIPITKTLTDTWQTLAQIDPGEAQPAMVSLLRNREDTVKFLASRLKPVAEIPQDRIATWVRELDGETFEQRAFAEKSLMAAGDQAEGMLRSAMKKPRSVEQRLRVERLLKRLEPTTDPEHLRQLRAVEILETIGSQDAISILEHLSAGAKAARLTKEARASLGRLKKGVRR